MDEKKEETPTPKKRKVNWTVIAIVIVLAITAVFFVRPGIIGYSVYQEIAASGHSLSEYADSVQALETELGIASANLSLHSDTIAQLQADSNTAGSHLTECQADLSTTKAELEAEKRARVADLNQHEDDLAAKDNDIDEIVEDKTKELQESHDLCLKALDEKTDETGEKQEDWEEFALNVAKSTCCKEKVDNPDISGYEIENNKLVCVESGGEELNCFS